MNSRPGAERLVSRATLLKDRSNSQVSDSKYILDECMTFWGSLAWPDPIPHRARGKGSGTWP